MPANLLAALDSFLYDLYGTANTAASGSSVSGRKFYKSIILPAIESADFRKRLMTEPETVLKEKDISLPEGVKVSFVENTQEFIHIVMPPYIGE